MDENKMFDKLLDLSERMVENVGKVKGYFELQNKDLEELQKTVDEVKKYVQDMDKKQNLTMIKMGAFYTGVLILAMVLREAIK